MMHRTARVYLPSFLILLAVLAVHGIVLWPEIALGHADQNDYSAHLALTLRIVQAVERGENPLDAPSPENSFGFPQIRTYQTLPHAMVALVYLALGKTISLLSIFVAFRWLAIVLLPASFYAAAVLFRLPPLTAAGAALLSPLIATNDLFGIELGSYVYLGRGLFAQAIASQLLLLTLGFAYRAVLRRGSIVLAGSLLGLTCLSHFIYGYIGALSICLLAAIPDPRIPRATRLKRVAALGAITLALSAYQLAPLIADRAILNHSTLEPSWKWDSYGAGTVLRWLAGGKLLDYGRVPVLSLLALGGAAVSLWRLRSGCRIQSAHPFLLACAGLWIALYFGRPFWGRALIPLGITADMQMHRLVGGIHIFLLLLAGVGLGALWRGILGRAHWLVAFGMTAVLLYSPVAERAAYLADNFARGRETVAMYQNFKGDLQTAIASALQRGGRLFAWPSAAPFYAFLGPTLVPLANLSAHSMSLTSDMLYDIRPYSRESYRQLNIRSVLVNSTPAQEPPEFLKPALALSEFRLLEAPGTGYFEMVRVPFAVATTRETFLQITDRWLFSKWTVANAHLWLDFGDAPAGMPHLPPHLALPEDPPAAPPAGQILRERQTGEVYEAEFDAADASFLLFRITWHPNWKMYIDGTPVRTAMLSPGFLGVRTTVGRHHALCRYEPGWLKLWMAIGGLLLVLLAGAVEYKRRASVQPFQQRRASQRDGIATMNLDEPLS